MKRNIIEYAQKQRGLKSPKEVVLNEGVGELVFINGFLI